MVCQDIFLLYTSWGFLKKLLTAVSPRPISLDQRPRFCSSMTHPHSYLDEDLAVMTHDSLSLPPISMLFVLLSPAFCSTCRYLDYSEKETSAFRGSCKDQSCESRLSDH